LAENVFYDWIFDASGCLLGVELRAFPGDGVLETHPEVLQLSYVGYDAPYLRVSFTGRRDGEPRPDDDFDGAFYTLPDGRLAAVLGTAVLIGVGEFEQLVALCSRNRDQTGPP
jgi:hypothetical protein